ncbi:MAG TPA: NADP oxidoreductase [Bacteroidales bacterium]|nr:NADP oxidoreductase [Bacteroidales bacterium]
MKKIAVLGTGSVGRTLASKFNSLGYQVMIGTRNVSDKLANKEKDSYGNPPFNEWCELNENIKLGTFAETASFGEIIVNATNGGNSINALELADKKNLSGKIIIDVANPLDFSKGIPPCLIPELSNTNSLGEEIQKKFPESKVVKTLNTMWCGLMVNPSMIAGGDHTVFIGGNDNEAKKQVTKLLISFGWLENNILDLGDISTARGTESVLPIWLRIWGAKQNGAFNMKIVS